MLAKRWEPLSGWAAPHFYVRHIAVPGTGADSAYVLPCLQDCHMSSSYLSLLQTLVGFDTTSRHSNLR
jgi:hypothetical protein